MREPYETLLGPYRDHWLLSRHLRGRVPDWAGLASEDLLGRLSSGEVVMLHIGLAIWNGDRTARIADLALLDFEHRRRALAALTLTTLCADV